MKRAIKIAVMLLVMILPAGTYIFGETGSDWMHIPLKDINTGEIFTVADFAGRPFLLETFAVWCPTCTKQQRELKKLHEEMGDSIVSISLDVDPNEDESTIKEHVARNGFNWRYAVSPPEMTMHLIQQFGNTVVVSPASPVILICEDQKARLLRRGVKSVQRLKEELAVECNLGGVE